VPLCAKDVLPIHTCWLAHRGTEYFSQNEVSKIAQPCSGAGLGDRGALWAHGVIREGISLPTRFVIGFDMYSILKLPLLHDL
jgi:hypothetical protein